MKINVLPLLLIFVFGIFATEEGLAVEKKNPDDLFRKGVRLAKKGEFSQAEPYFVEFLESESGKPVSWNLIKANGWMSDVARFAGRREEQLAYEQKALDLTKAAYEAGMYGRRICYLDACIFRLFEMFKSEWTDGRIGACKRILEQARPYYDELVSLTDYETHRGNWYHMVTNHKYGKWQFERLEADMLWASGQQQEMIAILENIVREIDFAASKAPLDERNLLQLHAHGGLAAHAYEEIGDFDRAFELFNKTNIKFEEYSYLNSNSALAKQNALKVRIRRDGADASTWREMDAVCAKALRVPTPTGRISVYRTYARVLLDAGEPTKALTYANKAMDAARSMNVRQWLPGTLRTRAAVYVAMNRPDDAIADLLEAVEMTRVTACKVDEAYLFQTYGRALCQKNEIMSALLVWEIGIELSERFHKPYLTLDILCDILEAHLDNEKLEDAWLTRQRIEHHLKKYPDIQPVWRKRLPALVRRYDALAAIQNAALSENREEMSETVISSTNEKALSESETKAGDTPAASRRLALQPVAIESAVIPGRMVNARFSAVNMADSLVQADVLFIDGVSQVRWVENTNDHLLTGYLNEDTAEQTNRPYSVSIGPGQVYNVVLHSVFSEQDAESEEQARPPVVLCFSEGENQYTASWRFGRTVADRRVAVMDAGLIEASPFYRIPFYHEIVVPNDGNTVVDIGLAASRSCRIEVYAEDSEEPVAIDCNGDGDFDDSGDAFYLDQNQNGIPDLPAGGENGTRKIEVWIYPYDATVSTGSDDIDVEVYVGENGQLELSAVDILSTK